MAPRVVRALLTATALLAPLLLASHLPPLPCAAAAGSPAAPTPAPAPAPAPAFRTHRPPPHQGASSGSTDTQPRRRPPLRPPGHNPRGRGARHPNPAPTVTPASAWWRRLNFGERFGVALAGAAVAMQVAVAAFLLALRARHRQRRRAAAPTGKAAEAEAQEEEAAETAAAAASRPAPA